MTTRQFSRARNIGKQRLLINLALGGGLLALLSAGFFLWQMSYVPVDLNISRTQTSRNGHFEVMYEPSNDPIPVGKFQSWTLQLTTPDGRGVEGAHITVKGDMPQHGHGLASQPQVTQRLGDGRYLLEGLKFQMGGWWVIEATITAGNVSDTVHFDLRLE